MEAVGAALAVASLTIQLVDGVERFRAFLEECKDPLVNISDLVRQLDAVRLLLDVLDKLTASPGSDVELSNGPYLKNEVNKSRSRLQQLLDLVAQFETESLAATGDPQSTSKKRRVRTYLSFYHQQRKIRRLTEKLNITRTYILDHFHVTLLANVSAIRTDQISAMSRRERSSLTRDGDTVLIESDESDADPMEVDSADYDTTNFEQQPQHSVVLNRSMRASQQVTGPATTSPNPEQYASLFHSMARVMQFGPQVNSYSVPNSTSSNSAAPASAATSEPSSTTNTVEIDQDGGRLRLRSSNKVTVSSTVPGSKMNLFGSKGAHRVPYRAQPHAQARADIPSDDRTSRTIPATDRPSTETPLYSRGNRIFVRSRTTERNTIDHGNEITIHQHAGETVMFHDEEEEYENDEEEYGNDEQQRGPENGASNS